MGMKRKRVCAILTAACLLCGGGLLPVQPLPAAAVGEAVPLSGSCGGQVRWVFDSLTGTLTVSGTGAPDIYPPEEWDDAFRDKVVHVVVEDGVTEIASHMFSYCAHLKDASFAESVRSIKGAAFMFCPELETVNIPDGVTKLGRWTFHSCKSLKAISLSESLAQIGEGVFMDCTALKAVQIPANVRKVDGTAFYGCTALQTVVIPETLTDVAGTAFDETAWLDAKRAENPLVIVNGTVIDGKTCKGSIVIPDGTKRIAAEAFGRSFGEILNTPCELTALTIPDSVTEIGQGAFAYCDTLKQVILPAGLQKIEAGTFTACKALRSIEIPQQVTEIGSGAFWDCKELEIIDFPDHSIEIDQSDYLSGTFSGTKWLTNRLAEQNPVLIGDVLVTASGIKGNLVIPDGVRVIAPYAFANCTELTGVQIPDSVQKIGAQAFSGCSSLQIIGLPPTVTEIGNNAFGGTEWEKTKMGTKPYLTVNGVLQVLNYERDSIVMPESVRVMPRWSVMNYWGRLKYITLPENVSRLEDEAIWASLDLEQLTILNPDCEIFDSAGTLFTTFDKDTGEHYFTGVIRGFEGSTAQAYAEKYNCRFVSLGAAPEKAVKRGDYDTDGRITAADAQTVLTKYAEMLSDNETDMTALQEVTADVNGDGRITALDAQYILTHFLRNEVLDEPTGWEDVIGGI